MIERIILALGIFCIVIIGITLIFGHPKPHYDTSPIYCERELPNSEH